MGVSGTGRDAMTVSTPVTGKINIPPKTILDLPSQQLHKVGVGGESDTGIGIVAVLFRLWPHFCTPWLSSLASRKAQYCMAGQPQTLILTAEDLFILSLAT